MGRHSIEDQVQVADGTESDDTSGVGANGAAGDDAHDDAPPKHSARP